MLINKKYKVGIIRVASFEDPKMLNLHGELIEKYMPFIETESLCIEDQPEGVHDLVSKAVAVPKILETAKKFKSPDAIIVSCADDPGVPELMEIMDIPIIGAGSSAAAMAKRYGGSTGIIGITDYVSEAFLKVFGDKVINLGKPDGINCTIDLMKKGGRESVIKKAGELKKAGASSISLTCTGMSTIGVAEEIEKAVGLPVVDPVLAEAVCAGFEILRNNKVVNSEEK